MKIIYDMFNNTLSNGFSYDIEQSNKCSPALIYWFATFWSVSES